MDKYKNKDKDKEIEEIPKSNLKLDNIKENDFQIVPPTIQRSNSLSGPSSKQHHPDEENEDDRNSFMKETLTPSSHIGIYRRYSVDDSAQKFRTRMTDYKILKKLKVLEYVTEKRNEFENILLKNGASQIIRAKDKFMFVLARLYNYKQKKQHYFLFDFCYYANVLLIFYLYGTNRSPILFKICFSFCNGPLIFATIAWRNSLVFHSLDKATSVLIHIFPAIVCSALRWNIIPAESHLDKNAIYTTWTDSLFIPLGFYLAWQTCYLYVMKLRKNTIKERNYITSLSFLTNHTGQHLINKVLNILPTKKIYVFILSQFLYTVLTILPCKFYYNNEYLHLGFIFTMLLVCLWNGANYYIEFFSQHYVNQLKEKEERWKKIIMQSTGNGMSTAAHESVDTTTSNTTNKVDSTSGQTKIDEYISPQSPIITIVGDGNS
ncbi:hypothetical protein PPL_07016 [Heterostelium album PN500]|uniref:Glycerophosphocholine acyltransferase 1 n=1 Tax=Heterostelium pallidum (strain ATCC 26659 / Pp 5 / PN500) TaxID=670386 RepID=D3BE63_HETP5|nr:hypothetical protein PPL_07016 [Heterostelium album PN500]EFA80194.1 hypothetical protein PPL_07016 [Heterostelium album PN500]|eukprot:XP_020432314.1 hypothetical protein PPL_07016 [Heterostelium album PN500]